VLNYGFFFGGKSIELLLQNLFIVIWNRQRLGLREGGGAAPEELADEGSDDFEGLGIAVIVCDDLSPVFGFYELVGLKYLLGSIIKSLQGKLLKGGVGGELLEVTRDFLAEEDDGTLVGRSDQAFKK
jgi:hypothetical protein